MLSPSLRTGEMVSAIRAGICFPARRSQPYWASHCRTEDTILSRSAVAQYNRFRLHPGRMQALLLSVDMAEQGNQDTCGASGTGHPRLMVLSPRKRAEAQAVAAARTRRADAIEPPLYPCQPVPPFAPASIVAPVQERPVPPAGQPDCRVAPPSVVRRPSAV